MVFVVIFCALLCRGTAARGTGSAVIEAGIDTPLTAVGYVDYDQRLGPGESGALLVNNWFVSVDGTLHDGRPQTCRDTAATCRYRCAVMRRCVAYRSIEADEHVLFFVGDRAMTGERIVHKCGTDRLPCPEATVMMTFAPTVDDPADLHVHYHIPAGEAHVISGAHAGRRSFSAPLLDCRASSSDNWTIVFSARLDTPMGHVRFPTLHTSEYSQPAEEGPALLAVVGTALAVVIIGLLAALHTITRELWPRLRAWVKKKTATL